MLRYPSDSTEELLAGRLEDPSRWRRDGGSVCHSSDGNAWRGRSRSLVCRGHPEGVMNAGSSATTRGCPGATITGVITLTRARHSTPKPASRLGPSNSTRPCAGKAPQRGLSATGTAAFGQLAGKPPPRPQSPSLGRLGQPLEVKSAPRIGPVLQSPREP